MRFFFMFAIAALAAAADGPTGFPFTSEELRYSANWPTGLSLGEGIFRAQRTDQGWDFSVRLSANVPTYTVSEHHRSLATASDLCSLRLNKESDRGKRTTREETVFDQSAQTASRTTEKGGKSSFSVPACARDALTFLYFTRRELGQGRVPPPQQIFFGAAYDIRLEYTGEQTINSRGRPAVTDAVRATVKGPKSDWTFEMFFARDAARTPLLIRVPFTLGKFSLELIR
jgi:hypothetical protein